MIYFWRLEWHLISVNLELKWFSILWFLYLLSDALFSGTFRQSGVWHIQANIVLHLGNKSNNVNSYIWGRVCPPPLPSSAIVCYFSLKCIFRLYWIRYILLNRGLVFLQYYNLITIHDFYFNLFFILGFVIQGIS